MGARHISDYEVVQAVLEWETNHHDMADAILMRRTGQSEQACTQALERAADRDFIEFGVSPRTGWLTPEGWELLLGPLAEWEPAPRFGLSYRGRMWSGPK
jgi:hypothetical protein